MDAETLHRWFGIASDFTVVAMLILIIVGGFRGWYVYGREHQAQLARLAEEHRQAMQRCDEAIAAAAAERAAITRELAELRAIVRDRARP
jgi:predicted negative regulator of RcsB-dependent stress response